MSNCVIDSHRTFQVWKYTVSHKQLVIRSTKSPELPTRIDVFFKGVVEFHLRTTLQGLLIAEASEAEARRLKSLRDSSFAENVKVFTVKGVDYQGYVAALTADCHEDEGEYHEPSFFAKNNIL